MGWGQVLQKWYSHGMNVDQQLDVSVDYIGYYTDNGNITVSDQYSVERDVLCSLIFVSSWMLALK